MKTTKLVWFTLAVLVCCMAAQAQVRDEQQLRRADKGKTGVNPQEVVSFEQTFSYVRALKAISEVSRKLVGKIIVDQSKPDSLMTIGVEIRALPWRDAMELILRTNNRWYSEGDEYFLVFTIQQQKEAAAAKEAPSETQPKQQPAADKPPTQQAPSTTERVPMQTDQPVVVKRDTAEGVARVREVTISAVFVAIDQSKLRESGLSFKILRQSGVNLGVEFKGTSRITDPMFSASLSPRDPRLAVDLDAALNFLESESIAEVITRPEVTVRSGTQGRVQVGVDFSIKSKTISGDIVDQFFSSGTILTVTPQVFTFDGVDLIALDLNVERSDVQPDALSTRVNKSSARTMMTLLNKEESYVGGLLVTEESEVREGIPGLKDLPWWFFGLRYLFGYNKSNLTRKDLMVFIRAELVETPLDRSKHPLVDQDTKKRLEEGRRQLQKHSTKK